jgi:exopolyphosphatase/guanosine-5'-triphosphate,3'-diphosphate pyrophosphatase
MEIAVLDLGATTFHLLHAMVFNDGRLLRRRDEKRTVRLGDGTAATGRIGKPDWNRGMDALGAMVALAQATCAHRFVTVATSVLRNTENGPAFADEARQRHDVEVEILSPEDEARLAYEGALSALQSRTGPIAVVDMGGGSMELAVGDGPDIACVWSLPLGALDLRNTFVPDGMLQWEAAAAIAVHARHELCDAADVIRAFSPGVVVFASGTARAVRQLAVQNPKASGKAGYLGRESLRRSIDGIMGLAPHEIVGLGVSRRRADTVGAAAIVVDALMGLLDVPEVWMADSGLREGVILREWRRDRARHLPIRLSRDLQAAP